VNETTQASWDGFDGTAGGAAFGTKLAELAAERKIGVERLGEATGLGEAAIAQIFAGSRRVGVSGLASLAYALRVKPIEFLQKTGILGLEAYAFGLDPLYFLPEGPTRYDARIYMREINPRHQVPEGDMTKRNPTLKVLADDEVLDPLGRLEVEFAYLLRAAVQSTGGRL
jgi:transcriptional regulator with XRE-family HTH domain